MMLPPSYELRKWFSHDHKKWREFKEKYQEELENKKELLNKIMQIEREKINVTLLYAAKNKEQNNATVLMDILKKFEEFT